MNDCDHQNLTLIEDIRHKAHKGSDGLHRQIVLDARCEDCNTTVSVDYNIAFIDGEKA